MQIFGPIVKNVEIFNKYISILFFLCGFEPKHFLASLPHRNKKSKKFWAKELRVVPCTTLLVIKGFKDFWCKLQPILHVQVWLLDSVIINKN